MTRRLFVISDTHFFHQGIVDHVRKQFKNLDEMHEHIIERWNSVVKEDDLVLHLGDVMNLTEPQMHRDFDIRTQVFKNNTNQLKSIMDRLNGKIILLPGNHDEKHLEYDRHFFNHAGFDSTEQNIKEIVIGKYIFTHVPIGIIPDGHINVHGHIHDGPSQELYDLDDKRINVNVEQIDYTPMLIIEEEI